MDRGAVRPAPKPYGLRGVRMAVEGKGARGHGSAPFSAGGGGDVCLSEGDGPIRSAAGICRLLPSTARRLGGGYGEAFAVLRRRGALCPGRKSTRLNSRP